MKRVIIVLIALCLCFVFAGCKSTDKAAKSQQAQEQAIREQQSGLPPFVRNARRNAPEDAIVGIGSAKLAGMNQSKTIAETRARAEISRALDSIVRDMVNDYQVSSEMDPRAVISYQETMTQALSRARLTGARISDEDWIDGTYFVVMYLSKSDVATEINQAQAAARLAVPQMAAFEAMERMDSALKREYNRELGVRSSD